MPNRLRGSALTKELIFGLIKEDVVAKSWYTLLQLTGQQELLAVIICCYSHFMICLFS